LPGDSPLRTRSTYEAERRKISAASIKGGLRSAAHYPANRMAQYARSRRSTLQAAPRLRGRRSY
jgi:hypothetical protein